MANTVFANKVIEAKATDLLTTGVNHRSFMTIDNSLAENEGMTKTINVYNYTGEVEILADGTKNTKRGGVSYEGKDYTVKRAQQVFDYTDSDFMKDSSVVDVAMKGANALMVNKMTEDFYLELAKVENYKELTTPIGYDAIVDAISAMNVEDESKLFVIIPNNWKKFLRKDEDYKAARMGEVIYNGQVGTICGIPVIATKALTNEAYVMTTEAVKLFMKKDVEVEQARDIETKTNSVVLSTYYICALVDGSKAYRLNGDGSWEVEE